MNLATAITLAVIVSLWSLAIVYIAKKGSHCSGCPNCKSCSCKKMNLGD